MGGEIWAAEQSTVSFSFLRALFWYSWRFYEGIGTTETLLFRSCFPLAWKPHRRVLANQKCTKRRGKMMCSRCVSSASEQRSPQPSVVFLMVTDSMIFAGPSSYLYILTQFLPSIPRRFCGLPAGAGLWGAEGRSITHQNQCSGTVLSFLVTYHHYLFKHQSYS